MELLSSELQKQEIKSSEEAEVEAISGRDEQKTGMGGPVVGDGTYELRTS